MRLFQRQLLQKAFVIFVLFLFVPGFSAIAIAEAFTREKFIKNTCILNETIEVKLQPFPHLDQAR
jgi:hypothetical protein